MKESKKILIVDDEPSILQSLKSIITKQFDIIVEQAASGQEAIDKLGESQDYHIVVSDFNMPNGNGLELFHFMHSNNIKSYFVLFSAYEEMKEHQIHNKVIHVEKPNIQKLLDTLEILP